VTPRLPPSILALTCAESLDLEPSKLLGRVEAAVDAGLSGVLLRERAWSDRMLLQTARDIRRILGQGWLGISDAPHLVRASGADGVHLSHRALSADEARALVGPGVAIGVSDHRPHARSDVAFGDYAFLSPVFEVPGKGPALGSASVIQWAQDHPLPAWGLGGLGAEDLVPLRSGGLKGCAFLRGILGASDPAGAFRVLSDSWGLGA
jgi:thiamine-phosphate pyrophosphorylase